jgi:predicted kinase
VIADSVNPIPETRRGWRKVAQRAKKHLLEIELICSDTQEHRRRVDSRKADIAGFELPSWEAVQQCFYAPWTEPRMVLDTARLGVGDAIGRIDAYIDAIPGQGPAGS